MTSLIDLAVSITIVGLLISGLLSFVRLIRGPTHADRVIALDLIGFVTISFIAVITLRTGHTAFLDIAITLALVLFLGTVAFARFMKTRLIRSTKNREDSSWKS